MPLPVIGSSASETGLTTKTSDSVELLIRVHFDRDRFAGLEDEDSHFGPLLVEASDRRAKSYRPRSANFNRQ
jgi:hypothetical protein